MMVSLAVLQLSMLLPRVVARHSVRGLRSWFRHSDMGSSESLLASKEADFIKEAVKDNCVVVFSKTSCGYCRMAKQVFEDIGTPYMAVELNNREDGGQIQNVLQAMTGESTVSNRLYTVIFNDVVYHLSGSTGFCEWPVHWWRIRNTPSAQIRGPYSPPEPVHP